MSAAKLSTLDRFDKTYPSGLPARLAWLEERLQLDRGLILRLMGLSKEETALVETRPWSWLAREYEPRAERAEHFLTHYLSYFDYDAKRARAFAEEFATNVVNGVYSLSDFVPAFTFTTTADQRKEALLTAIQQDGSGLLPALAFFMASPGKNGSAPTRPT